MPRFLLNDFARYWWTMAVDFAYKQRNRFGKGAAIRNLKLRMSRKLIYVSGLLACFACHLEASAAACPLPSGSQAGPECIRCLRERLRLAPLQAIAQTFLRFPHLDPTARKLFGAYDQFLGLLADPESRNVLESLSEDQFESNLIYQRGRGMSHGFRDALLDLFFDEPSGIGVLTKTYGVF